MAITHKRSEPLSLAPVSAYCRNTFIDRGEKTVEVGAAKKKKNDKSPTTNDKRQMMNDK